MTRQEVKKTILTYFIQEFNETTPVHITNQGFYKCTSPLTPSEKPSNEPWIRFIVKNNNTQQWTLGRIGSRRWERYGFISCQVFIQENTGTNQGDTLCEEIIGIFEGERLGQICFKKGVYEEIGANDGWFQFNIIIDYQFDETK